MPRLLLLAGALMVAGPAAADWTPVGAANEIYAAYADRDSIRRAGASATMHGLFDFRRQDYTPEGRALLSTAVLKEYDCDGHRVRLLSAVDFAGRMGAGEAVSTSARPGRWESPAEGGVDDAFWQIACGAK